jgi:hypothetical protein
MQALEALTPYPTQPRYSRFSRNWTLVTLASLRVNRGRLLSALLTTIEMTTPRSNST